MVVAVVLVASGSVAAYTSIFTTGSGTTYEASNGLTVSTSTPHGLDSRNPFNDTNTIFVDGVEISSTSAASVTVDQFRGDRTQLSSIETAGGTLTVDPDDKSAVTISGDVTALAWTDAALDGSNQLTYSANGSGTIKMSGVSPSTSYAAVTTSGDVLSTGTTTSDGKVTIEVNSATDEDVVLLEPRGPSATVVSPMDTTTSAGSVTIDADVSDPNFGGDYDEQVTAELVVNGSVVDSASIGANQTVSLTDSNPQHGTQDYRVGVTDTFNNSDSSQTYTITGEYDAPALSPDPADEAKITTRDPTLSAKITDDDFAVGDSVEVAISLDGIQIHSETVTSNQTVSTDISPVAGTHDWTVEATDQYGRSTSQTYSFSTPSTLSIRPERNTSALVDGTNVSTTVQFYTGDQIYTRTTSTGTLNLTGLPTGERFAVVLSADGYYRRRVIIDSLFQQQEVYLLKSSATAVEKKFVLNDVSGNFPAESTRLYVQRSINNSTTYKTVAADYFGATSAFSTYLQTDERYRLVVENDQGDRRTLGSYTPVAAGVETLKIEGVGLYTESEQGYIANASARQLDSGQRQVVVRYHDPANETSQYSVTVHERDNASNETYQESVSGPVTNYSAYVDVANNTNYVVNWSATRNGQQISGTRPVGGTDLGIRIPLDNQWLGTIGMVTLVFLAALGGQRYASHIALTVVAFAGVLMYLAVIDIYLPGWWGALVIAAGAHLATRRPAAS